MLFRQGYLHCDCLIDLILQADHSLPMTLHRLVDLSLPTSFHFQKDRFLPLFRFQSLLLLFHPQCFHLLSDLDSLFPLRFLLLSYLNAQHTHPYHQSLQIMLPHPVPMLLQVLFHRYCLSTLPDENIRFSASSG